MFTITFRLRDHQGEVLARVQHPAPVGLNYVEIRGRWYRAVRHADGPWSQTVFVVPRDDD